MQLEFKHYGTKKFKNEDRYIMYHVGHIMSANVERILSYITSHEKIVKTYSLIDCCKLPN